MSVALFDVIVDAYSRSCLIRFVVSAVVTSQMAVTSEQVLPAVAVQRAELCAIVIATDKLAVIVMSCGSSPLLLEANFLKILLVFSGSFSRLFCNRAPSLKVICTVSLFVFGLLSLFSFC